MREVSSKEAIEFSLVQGCVDYYEGSALTRKNVKEAFERIILEVEKKKFRESNDDDRKKTCVLL